MHLEKSSGDLRLADPTHDVVTDESIEAERSVAVVEAETPQISGRLYHRYLGYDDPFSPPPVGAVALCGYVRQRGSKPGDVVGYGDPDACLVCDDLEGDLHA